MHPGEERFLEAIHDSPNDEALRLVYADWLDDRDDPRAEYLRHLVESFRPGIPRSTIPESLWSAWNQQPDKVWAALVSPAPLGILVRDLTFHETDPRISRVELEAIEDHWGARLPPDYTAFLLRYNGGRPSKPNLFSYVSGRDEVPPDRTYHYATVGFHSTRANHTGGRPYLLMNVVELFAGHIAPDQDKGRLARMMPIGTLTHEDGWENTLVLDMRPEPDADRILEVSHWPEDGLSLVEGFHSARTFVDLLMELCDQFEDIRHRLSR